MTTLFILLIFLLIGYTPLGFQIQIVAFDKLADCAADILHWLLLRRTWTPHLPKSSKAWMRSNFTWCLLWEFFRPRLKHVQKGERKQKMRVLESQSTAKRYNTYYRCDRKAPYLVVSSSALYPAREKGEDLKVKKCWSESVWQSTRLKKTERDSYPLPTLSLIYRV